MWNVIDQYDFNNDKFNLIEDKYTCDNDTCFDPYLKTPFHHYKIGDGTCIDICDKCFNDDDVIESLFMLRIIDEKEKRICMICNIINDGFWIVCKYSGIYIYICEWCVNDDDKNIFDDYDDKKIFDMVKGKFIIVSGDVVCCNRSMFPSMINIDKVNDRCIPLLIKKEITFERLSMWVDLYESIVNISPNFQMFGSVRRWALFTDLYEVPYRNLLTGLLFDCVDERVAILVVDKYNRVSINVMYDVYDNYLIEYGIWLKNKLSEFELVDMVYKLSGKNVSKVDICMICEEFSGYLLMTYGMPIAGVL
jgi:hypothetical protein